MTTTLGVIGTGRLGATHAACLAEMGFDVVGVDLDAEKVAALGGGRPPFHEPGIEELLRRHLARGRIRFTGDVAEAAGADAHFLCVGTAQRADGGAADTTAVFESLATLLPHLRSDTVVVGTSTVPVGTAAQLQSLADRAAPAGVRVEVAWNPEFLRQGSAVLDTLRPDRLVFGVSGESGEKLLREVYAELLDEGTPLVVTDLASAELVKVSANAFLATKVSFVNAVADLCEAAGGDVAAVAEALGHDPRIGHQYLRPGLGFGGGGLPQDVRGLLARAEELGVGGSLGFLRQVDAINQQRRDHVVDLVVDELGGRVAGKRVAVLGAAFKPETDDVRDSPALAVAAQLQRAGASVSVHDPQALANARGRFPALRYVDDVHDAVRGARVVVHATEWPEFSALAPDRLGELVGRRVLVDARNTLDADRWRECGWVVRAPGRPRLEPFVPAGRTA